MYAYVRLDTRLYLAIAKDESMPVSGTRWARYGKGRGRQG